MAKYILVVDDDALLRRSLGLQLEQAGYRVETAVSAEDALSKIKRETPDLVLLDVGLPGMDGLQAIRAIQQNRDIPVIFVTARRREFDEILGLEMGADGYITKPFSPDVLLAHVKSVLRRSGKKVDVGVETAVTIGDMVIDAAAHTVTIAGEPIHLTGREFDVLHALALDVGHVVSIDDLLDRVWGLGFEGESQAVYVHIRWLREKIEKDPNKPTRIVNVRGKGYKLMAQTD